MGSKIQTGRETDRQTEIDTDRQADNLTSLWIKLKLSRGEICVANLKAPLRMV